MAIRRVKTHSSRLGVLNLDDYEFDPGFLGFCQRLRVSSRNATVRTYRAFRFFITSFLGLHYVYIICWSLVLSWILYPERNMTYTDALFQAVSAMTLTGLNTVDLNDMKLYQQIFLFATPVFTHPLFISTFMVFYRLYLYRQKFADIEQTSKFQAQLRHAATLSQYETVRKGGYGRYQPQQEPHSINLQLHKRSPSPLRKESEELQGDHKNLISKIAEKDSPEPHDESDSTGRVNKSKQDDSSSTDQAPEEDSSTLNRSSESTSEPTSESVNNIHDGDINNGNTHDGDVNNGNVHGGNVHGGNIHSGNVHGENVHSGDVHGGNVHGGSDDETGGEDDDGGNKIRFGALPRPPSRERQNDPQEMYRSLRMMRNQNLGDEMDEDDGPALVIKSPRDIEADERRGIHSAVVDTSGGDNRNNDNHESSANNTGNNNYNNHGGGNYNGNYSNHPFRRMSTATTSDGLRPHRTLTRADTIMSMASSRQPKSMKANYLSWTPTVGRNSAFIGLTTEQKEELGGVEYQSLKMLRWITISYMIIVLTLGWLFLIPWVYKQRTYAETIRGYGVSPVTFAMTTTLSGFNNCGYCVLPSSLTDFWHTAYIPVVISFLVMAGNVAVPIILRYTIYIIFRLSPRFGHTHETLGFLLDHPRRCFMLLFPSTTTWWLTLTIFIFIIVEVAFFMILDHGDHSPHPDMSTGPRLLSAYFQSIAVRTVGFTMIDISGQAPGMLVLNIVMMYIAIYPVAMSIRKSNVYEEQTLGHYYTVPSKSSADDRSYGGDMRSVASNAINDDDDDDAPNRTDGNDGFLQRLRRLSSSNGDRRYDDSEMNSSREDGDADDDEDDEDEDEDDRPSTLVDHMRRQLSMDVWSLILGLFLVAISEGGSITKGRFSMFAVVFEVVSAHGTIGWSLGLPGTSVSLCGGFSNVGKLVMMAIMIRGRHRAMPYNVDRAIILKGSDLVKRDDKQENRVRNARVMTHREPSQDGQWLPRVATTASRLTNFGTLRRRSTSRQNTERSTTQNHHFDDNA